MPANATGGTIIGAAVVAAIAFAPAAIAFAPKVYDRIVGKEHDDADTAALLSSGAGSVVAASLALMARSDERETECRAALAEANARIDALAEQVEFLRPDPTAPAP